MASFVNGKKMAISFCQWSLHLSGAIVANCQPSLKPYFTLQSPTRTGSRPTVRKLDARPILHHTLPKPFTVRLTKLSPECNSEFTEDDTILPQWRKRAQTRPLVFRGTPNTFMEHCEPTMKMFAPLPKLFEQCDWLRNKESTV